MYNLMASLMLSFNFPLQIKFVLVFLLNIYATIISFQSSSRINEVMGEDLTWQNKEKNVLGFKAQQVQATDNLKLHKTSGQIATEEIPSKKKFRYKRASPSFISNLCERVMQI